MQLKTMHSLQEEFFKISKTLFLVPVSKFRAFVWPVVKFRAQCEPWIHNASLWSEKNCRCCIFCRWDHALYFLLLKLCTTAHWIVSGVEIGTKWPVASWISPGQESIYLPSRWPKDFTGCLLQVWNRGSRIQDHTYVGTDA